PKTKFSQRVGDRARHGPSHATDKQSDTGGLAQFRGPEPWPPPRTCAQSASHDADHIRESYDHVARDAGSCRAPLTASQENGEAGAEHVVRWISFVVTVEELGSTPAAARIAFTERDCQDSRSRRRLAQPEDLCYAQAS